MFIDTARTQTLSRSSRALASWHAKFPACHLCCQACKPRQHQCPFLLLRCETFAVSIPVLVSSATFWPKEQGQYDRLASCGLEIIMAWPHQAVVPREAGLPVNGRVCNCSFLLTNKHLGCCALGVRRN